MRQALRWFLVWDLVAVIGVVIGVVALSAVTARTEALRDAEVTARAIAETIVAPLADTGFHRNDPAAVERMTEVLENRARDGSISHIKVWADAGSGRGTVLWSNQKPLVGQTFRLDREEYALFGTRGTVSGISDLRAPENVHERSDGRLVEVYTGTTDASGAPLLFEVYLSTARLPQETRDLIGVILPLPLVAVLVLSLATLPLAVSLAHRVDRGQQQMQALLVNAVVSSDRDRRRIAQDLHDGVVQDLAAIGYSLDSEARQLPPRAVLREHLEQMGDLLRGNLATLRTLVTAIYPPNLATEGLAATVRELVVQQDLPPGIVSVDIAEPLSPHPVVDRLTYRVIRESLANIVKHAAATSVVVRIREDESTMVFEVIDDGVGFDTSSPPPAGHFGMRLITEMVASAGGTLSIGSVVGHGTRVHGVLPF